MARFKNGILGGFSGKIGNVVGYEMNGEWVGRTPPRKKTKAPTLKELANRAKFGMVQLWLKPITPFLRVGFKDYNPKFQGFSAAKSYNSKNAVTGAYPDFGIDPALALVSHGTLSQAETASVTVDEPLTITVKWEGGVVGNMQKAMILLYDIEAGSALMDTAATWRQSGIFEWKMAPQKKVKNYHVYLAFTVSDMSLRSTSQYLGKVTIA